MGEQGSHSGGRLVHQFDAVVADAGAHEVGEVGSTGLGLWGGGRKERRGDGREEGLEGKRRER